MIDRLNRDRLALAVRRLASGRITNDEFDEVGEAFLALRHKLERCDCGYDLAGLTGAGLREERCPECGRVCDPALSEVACRVWLCYGDLRKYHLRGEDALDREERREIARAILFLKTDLEYRYGSAVKDSTILGGPAAAAMTLVGCGLGAAWLAYMVGVVWGPRWLMAVGVGVFVVLFGLAWVQRRRVSSRTRRSARDGEAAVLPVAVFRELWPFWTEAEFEAARGRRVFLCGVGSGEWARCDARWAGRRRRGSADPSDLRIHCGARLCQENLRFARHPLPESENAAAPAPRRTRSVGRWLGALLL